ncbi:MAG: tRNA pseudouridine(38-40) synthase TruA [Firmicutes bacterium]|nr:tRNA pseudouridine(38-40) synthase TruA [Bacillota bacterium]
MIFKCTVAYDGSNYAGWQKQENALGIQSVIEKCLSKIYKTEIDIVASGRTDAKVHALGQVFHFEADERMSSERIQMALNTLLPKDIRLTKVEEEQPDFHARFSAKSKRYDYLCTYEKDNPFVYKYKTILARSVNVELMKEAAQYLLGTHDFTSYCSSKIDPRKPREKTIYRIDILEEGKDIRFIFEGTGFLRYQVRMMTASLLMVGQEKIEPIEIKNILEAKSKDACRYNVDGNGLYLMEVRYS